MQVIHFYTPGLSINSYLVYDEQTRKGAVIDPTRQIETYLAKAMQEKIEITDIMETHVHADFVSGAKELKAALGGKPIIHCSGMGGEEWIPAYTDHTVGDRDQISLGNVFLEAVHTPGHTPEHLIWLAYDEARSITAPCLLFSGDLLFVGSVGRPDLLGAHVEEFLAKQLYRSLFSVLHALPDYLEVYPGHGAESLCGKGISSRETTTLGYEKRCNPWLLPQTYARWHEQLQLDTPAAPEYFKWMKQVNITGIDPAGAQEMPPVLTRELYRELSEGAVTLDTRGAESFAVRHLRGAVNVPFAPHFITWVGSIIPANSELILFVENPNDVWAVVQALRLIGYDKIRGVCLGSQWHWDGDEKGLSTIDVKCFSAQRTAFEVVDVRTQAEWNQGHIEGAVHIELTKLARCLSQLSTEKPLAIVCRSGTRASVAASFLVNNGFNASNVRGGMLAWSKAQVV